ncbi:putative ABC transport system permease protein [Dyadobacter sp. SG02]|uniref:ABC transporter permease n=1 Tax=Dyadobacter sp. SG02 TaxID=1855291 RepID=UPI0008ADDB9F|nr:ABC transporter permease [Dyadobacter sp. SG02]SEI53647.1 putative ABC transport system permease protein [Dyadobacter sp. SG02]
MSAPDKHPAKPPGLADRLLQLLLAPHLLENILGDLHEDFAYNVKRAGETQARRHYWREASGFVKPRYLKRRKDYPSVLISHDMISNYFKIAWRNLVNHKVYSAINIFGLTSGLVVGILILLWVRNELGFDRFHGNHEHIYRVLSNMGKGEDRRIWANSHAPIATFAKAEIPEIENAVRIKNSTDFVVFRYKDKQIRQEKQGYVDPAFFKMFDFKMLKGIRSNPFPAQNSVILTASAAERYFGDQDPVGQVLTADGKESFVVSGLVEDFPDNSSIQFEMLFPMALYAKKIALAYDGKTMDEDWGNFTYTTFLQLNARASHHEVAGKMAKTLVRNFRDIGMSDPYALQPLSEMHLYQTDGSDGLIRIVRIFLVVGILILFIACVNYINLATARAVVRAKEVSVRKMIGAGKFQLFMQFILETVLVFFLATLAAMILAYLLMPFYNNLTGKSMSFTLLNTDIWVMVGVVVFSTLALSSIYPALLLSSFEPLKALKGGLSGGVSAPAFRKILVTSQFAFSVALICGTIVIDRQLAYINAKQLGYDKEHVVRFELKNMAADMQSVRNTLLNSPGILGVTSASDLILDMAVTTTDTDWEGKSPDQKFFIHPLAVDKDFLTVFKLPLAAGQGFKGIASDSTHFILNETAVREAGIKNPVGKRFTLFGKAGTIVGVVRDFHFASLKQKIEPAILQYGPVNDEMYVKTNGRDAAQVIAGVEKLWKQYNADAPFAYTFLDQTYNHLYKSEQRLGVLFNFFSIVAILISCLGLFGLATYTARVKTKEVGIRKVMGATVAGIVQLLVKDFIGSVLIAILIATPLAWYGLNKWLQGYAYRIDAEWWMFALAGLIAVLIALVTVSSQSIKTALTNPVKSLRSE